MAVYTCVKDPSDIQSVDGWVFQASFPLEFGNWKVVASNLTLKHKVEYWEIDLERCNTTAQILDWIFHMRNKSHWRDQDTLDLLEAFSAILEPMSNFCHGGHERRPIGGAKPIVEKYLRKEV